MRICKKHLNIEQTTGYASCPFCKIEQLQTRLNLAVEIIERLIICKDRDDCDDCQYSIDDCYTSLTKRAKEFLANQVTNKEVK